MSFDTDKIRDSVDLVAVAGSYTTLIKDGAEWKGPCPIHGGTKNNFYVVPDKKIWACFSRKCHEAGHGADVIALVMQVEGIDFIPACEKLGGINGYAAHEWKPNLKLPKRPKMPDRVTSTPPDGTLPPNMELRKLGAPVASWCYKNAEGKPIGYIARYETPAGKDYRPWTWGNHEGKQHQWGIGAFSKPRPLYNLDQLASRPLAPVLVCEGEKAAEAARGLLSAYVAVTWPGGASAHKAADFEPLRGRRVVLWPDNDTASIDAMNELAEILVDPQGLACAVKVLRPQDDDTLGKGFDAADWSPEMGSVTAWAKAHMIEKKPQDRISVTNEIISIINESDDNPIPESAAPELADSASVGAEPLRGDTPEVADPLKPVLSAVEGSGLPKVVPNAQKSNVRPIRKPKQAPTAGGNALSPEDDFSDLPEGLEEDGVATEFAALHQDNFRCVHEWASKHGPMWLSWTGSRWKRDPSRVAAMQAAKILAAKLQFRKEAQALTPLSKTKFRQKRFITSFMDLAQFDPRMIASGEVFDTDPYMLGTPGGVVDLRIGKLIEAERDHYITRQTTVTPKEGPHPLFDSVVNRVSEGDEEMRRYIWKWLGLFLLGHVPIKAFLFLHGKRDSGKTTLIETCANILGKTQDGGYATTIDMEILTETRNDKGHEKLAHLFGARLVYASETEEGRHWKAALVKWLTGKDTLEGRFLYAEKFSFKPTHKLVIFGNERPHLKQKDEGLESRMHLIEYPGVISREEMILDMDERLVAEYPAILASMMRGCLDFQENGMSKPAKVSDAVDNYAESEDTLGAFIDEMCVCDRAARVPAGNLYRSFKHWAERRGEFVLSQKRFSTSLETRGFGRDRAGGARLTTGIRLQDDTPPPNYDYDR